MKRYIWWNQAIPSLVMLKPNTKLTGAVLACAISSRMRLKSAAVHPWHIRESLAGDPFTVRELCGSYQVHRSEGLGSPNQSSLFPM